MKTNILKSVFFVALAIGTLSSCVNDDNYDIPALDCTQPNLTANRTIPQVIAASTPLVTQYAFDDVIEAYVVSSDEAGNFYKSISLQTLATATTPAVGFSVPVDASNTYVDYRPGVKVFIKMKDLYTDIVYGSMRIGDIYVNPSSSIASVGRLPQTKYKDKLIASCTNVSETVLVKQLTVSQLLNDANLNTLCEISGVQFTDAAVGRRYYESANDLGGATNWNLSDVAGNKVIFRTSSYATYASKLVPSGNGKVRGVLTKYNADYQFIARSENDVQLTGTRSVPLYEETFSSNFPLWTKINVTGAQVWTLDTTYGNPGSCAKMSGYAGGNIANEDWLISPSISLAGITTAVLSADTATKFAGNAIEILVSSNYVSGAPSTATWTPLTGTLSPSTGNYVWTATGGMNINSFAGSTNFRVAFKYTSTAAAAATWEVDNVKIVGN
jgi:hypothetical protein